MSEAGQQDLTARARIREAALDVFAERGAKGATIRAIAGRAGVSPALLQHHFGTKDELRTACDEHVLGFLRRGVSEGLDDGRLGQRDFTAEIHRDSPLVLRYLLRALVEQSPGSAAMFAQIVDLTEPYLIGRDQSVDPRARATVLVAMRLGLMVLAPQVGRELGTDLFTDGGTRAIAPAMLDILDPALFDPEIRRRAEQAIAEPKPKE